MKNISAKFADTLKRKAISVQRQMYYKRRYWVAGTSSYTWEGSWTRLAENAIVSVSPITSQLDTQTQNSFNISTVTLVLANLQKQWRPDNLSGKFAVDAGSTTGYEPYWTKFQVRAGIVFDDGTNEILTLFTGVATDLNFSARQGTVQITVSGLQSLLIKANAENVSTAATNESLGTGDGSTLVFSTAHTGVGLIKSVSVAGTAKSPGLDYTTSKLNSATNAATITFVVAPAAGAAVTATYIYWYQTQKLETLITLLLTQASIPVGNQQVSPVVFPGNITVSHTWQLLADWTGAGTSLTNIDSTTTVNSLLYYYDDVQTWPSTLTGWTQATTGTAALGTSGSGITATPGSTVGTMAGVYRAMTNAFSTWQISFTDSQKQNSDHIYWGLMAGSFAGTGSSYIFGTGYVLAITCGASYVMTLIKTDSSGTAIDNGGATVFPARSSAGTHIIKVLRRTNSTFQVYFDGTLVLTYTDAGTPYLTSAYTGTFFQWQGTLATDVFTLNTASYLVPHSSSNQGTWISGTIDLGATPSSWNSLLYTQTLNGGTITYYTRTSVDGTTWDAYVAVSGIVIGSALKRYVQVKAVIDITSGDPILTNITLSALTNSTVITLANFSGTTIYDAITQIAGLANYEFGFDSSENFFFRQKKLSSTPQMTLDHTNYLADILALTQGYDLVYTGVRATYGGYVSEIDDVAGTISAPTARFGYALYQPSASSFLIPADANLASNIAQNLFNYYNLPRRRVKVETKFLPQIDLSDIVQVSFLDNQGSNQWYYGETDIYYGKVGVYYKDTTSMGDINNLIGKVIGYRVDTEKWSCEMDLEEVI